MHRVKRIDLVSTYAILRQLEVLLDTAFPSLPGSVIVLLCISTTCLLYLLCQWLMASPPPPSSTGTAC